MKNLAIIPARAGSKRIPRKNIKNFLGKPIIAYSIQTALETNLFEEVMVSTDDEMIADIAEKYGARVPFLRSKKNANDLATLSDVIEEVKHLLIKQLQLFDHICCILPTAPLLTADMLKEGLDLLIKKNADSVRPVVRFGYPIRRSFKMDADGLVRFLYPEYAQTRSQDLEPAFHDAGMFYWMKFSSGLKEGSRFAFEIPEESCQDIDSMTDWRMAELKYQLRNK